MTFLPVKNHGSISSHDGGEIRDRKEICDATNSFTPLFWEGLSWFWGVDKNYISNRNPPKVFLVRFGYLAKWVEYHHVDKKSHTHQKELAPSPYIPYLHLSHKNSPETKINIGPWKTRWLMDVLFLRVFGLDYHSQLRWGRISFLHDPFSAPKCSTGDWVWSWLVNQTPPPTHPLQK